MNSKNTRTVESVNQIVDSVAAFIKSVVPPTMELVDPAPEPVAVVEKPAKAKRVVRIPRKVEPPKLSIDPKKLGPKNPPDIRPEG